MPQGASTVKALDAENPSSGRSRILGREACETFDDAALSVIFHFAGHFDQTVSVRFNAGGWVEFWRV